MSLDKVDLSDQKLLDSVTEKTEKATVLLRTIASNYAPATLANSLSVEDMVLTDLIDAIGAPIEIFTLDTGRLPIETYELMAEIKIHYGVKLKLYFPRYDLVETYTREHGINAFYESLQLRKECCYVRKVEPLRRALTGKRAWITGMRAQQAASREGLPVQFFDEANGLEKFNPLADWTEKEVWGYIKQRKVPFNALHEKHYPSIGCAPCTRAISVGEDIRSGRWWWEYDPEAKECGLHVTKI